MIGAFDDVPSQLEDEGGDGGVHCFLGILDFP